MKSRTALHSAAKGGGVSQSVGETAAGAALDTHKQLTKQAEKQMLEGAPRVTRFVLKRIPDGPGFVYDATRFATSPDKLRTGLGIAGSIGGGALGFALGGPVGSGIGSGVGDGLATEAYDHREDIARGLEAAKQWMAERNAEVAGR